MSNIDDLIGSGVIRSIDEAEVRRLRRLVDSLKSILADRERELLVLKGPCSNKTCRLHYAHSGPCNIVGR